MMTNTNETAFATATKNGRTVTTYRTGKRVFKFEVRLDGASMGHGLTEEKAAALVATLLAGI
jgi:hypothetical protein